MFDLLSLLQGKGDKTLTGSYYSRVPIDTKTVSQGFEYELIEPRSRQYQMLTSNLKVDGNVVVIKTYDANEWIINGYVVLQDGKLYTIESIRDDISNTSKEAFRLEKDIANIDYIVRLYEVANPWGIK